MLLIAALEDRGWLLCPRPSSSWMVKLAVQPVWSVGSLWSSWRHWGSHCLIMSLEGRCFLSHLVNSILLPPNKIEINHSGDHPKGKWKAPPAFNLSQPQGLFQQMTEIARKYNVDSSSPYFLQRDFLVGTLTCANCHCVIFSQLTKRSAETDGGELVLKKARPSEIRIVRVHTHIYSMCTHTHTQGCISPQESGCANPLTHLVG